MYKDYLFLNKKMFNLLVYLFIGLIKLTLANEEPAAQWNTNDYLKRQHSLVKPYQAAGMSLAFWDFLGLTLVTNNYVRLTADLQSRHGAIWNTMPVTMNNWEVQINLKIHGKGKELFGDGMAFWYVRDRMQSGPVFGNKDYFSGLGIILDTYSNHNGEHNHNHPYLSAMINNGTLHYDHDRDGTHTQIAGCEIKLRNVEHDSHVAIRYENEILTVSTDMENKAAWKECFSVSGIKLPTGYYYGVSAATGDLSDNHDVISIRTYELELPGSKTFVDRSHIIPSADKFEPPRERVPDQKSSSSGIKWFFIILISLIVIAAVAVVGVMFYQKYQENTRKRFY